MYIGNIESGKFIMKRSSTQINSLQTNNNQVRNELNKNEKTMHINNHHKHQEETTTCQTKIKKKVKFSNHTKENLTIKNHLNIKKIWQQLKQQSDDNYFTQQSMQSEVQKSKQNAINNNISFTFPSPHLPQLKQSHNELLTRKIEIMSNKNQKISIPIHQGLYKSNTNHKNFNQQQLTPQIIKNLCNFKMKNEYSESIEFLRDYKSGYIPIQMQKRNHQEVEHQKKQVTQLNNLQKVDVKDKSRSHFIRKQQSTLSLPRTCGVSYIKESQSLSTQKPPFQPLPSLIFQGSTSCVIGSNNQTSFQLNQAHQKMINKFVLTLENSWLPFIASDEEQMRDLLLSKKTMKAKVGFVKGVQNLWPLFVEGSFILIIISHQQMTTQQQVWNVFENKLSYFKIGILSKRSTSGKKAFLKSIKSQQTDNVSVASVETRQNDMKDELIRDLEKQQENIISNSQKSQSSQINNSTQNNTQDPSKKILNTFQLLQQQLKDSRTVITMGLRLQMYVQEKDWKQKYTRQDKQILNQIVMKLKQTLQKKSIKVICHRLELGKELKNNLFYQNFYFLRICNNNNKTSQGNLCQKKPQCNSYKISNLFNSGSSYVLSKQNQNIVENTVPCSPTYFLNNLCTQQSWKKSLKFPLYYITTRDSFAFDLLERKTLMKRSNGRQYTKIDYYFYSDNIPTNFGPQYRKLFPNFQVGVTAYHGFFTDQQLKNFEEKTFSMEKNSFRNKFSQMTVQPSIVSTKIKRTKFFFGYRYMWTRCQLTEPCSYVGAGVRKDVAQPPVWTKDIQNQMVKDNIIEKDFINSIAINVYHDGKQGLAQHFDDAVRFKQPIYTLRLFSDARLSFGSQFYGFCNGAFIIPLPRGCILEMQQNSYAANGVKHCVRPCDMTGKSAAVILRQMHSQVVVNIFDNQKSEASKYDELIDFPGWLSCLSEDEKSITYSQQKRVEAQQIMNGKIEQ